MPDPAPDVPTGIRFGACYVTDFDAARTFYESVLGLEVGMEAMPGQVVFYRLGGDPFGIMLCRVKDSRAERDGMTAPHASFVLSVQSASALFRKLTSHGVEIPQPEPVAMGEGDFWFQFYDPAGNLLEVLGGE